MFPDPFDGATVNAVELQIVDVCATTNGFGSTVTVVVNVEPTHVPDVGVTVYDTVSTPFVVFVNVWLILFCAVASAVSPVTFALAATVHVYVVPNGTMFPEPFAGDTVNAFELQIVALCAITDGLGLTVTAMLNGAPEQLPDVGVTEYVTVIGAFVELTNVPDVNELAAVPLDIPVRPKADGAVHVYVVPAGTMSAVPVPPPFEGLTVDSVPEQIVGETVAMNGLGFTTNGTVKALPAQPKALTGRTE